MYTALAEIPRKLELVGALTQVHYRSHELFVAADLVFVALFDLLERIIDELSKSMRSKSRASLSIPIIH